MKKMFSPFLLGILFMMNAQSVFTQSNEKKIEVGGQYSSLGQNSGVTLRVNGGGPRFGFNPVSRIGLEAEVNFFPGRVRFSSFNYKSQALFGVKIAAWRGKKFAIYGKARPGFVRTEKVLHCSGTDLASCRNSRRNELAVDLGGIVEYNFAKRSFMRIDFGDTIIRHKSRNTIVVFPEAPGGLIRGMFPGRTTHNRQFSVGFGFRF
jgi:hypothetical protein